MCKDSVERTNLMCSREKCGWSRVNKRSWKGTRLERGRKRDVPDLECHVRDLDFIQITMGSQWKVSIRAAYLCH